MTNLYEERNTFVSTPAPIMSQEAAPGTGGWIRDLPSEQLIRRLGAQWEYLARVPIGMINQTASLQNQARIGESVNQQTAQEYAAAMRNGADFPALVAFLLPDGTYVLAGGNHRLAAALAAERPTVDLYVLQVRDQGLRRLITMTLNMTNSVRPKREDSLIQAVTWMNTYGKSATQAAYAWGLPVSAIWDYQRSVATRSRMRKLGFQTISLPKSHISAIASLTNDHVLKEVVSLDQTFRLSAIDLNQIIADVKANRTEEEQLDVVRRWSQREDLRERRLTGGASAKSSRRTPISRGRAEMMRLVNSLDRFVKRQETIGQCGLAVEDDYTHVNATLFAVLDRLEKLNEERNAVPS